MTLAVLIPAALIGIGATWWASAQYLKAWGIRDGESSPAAMAVRGRASEAPGPPK